MDTLFIIGNGFDINLGLLTSYRDFYKHYMAIKSSSEVVNQIKKHISSDIDSWSDLEIELGKYTSQVENHNDFIEIHEDIGDNLAEYLRCEQLKLAKVSIDTMKFYSDVCYPLLYLTNKEKDYIAELLRGLKRGHGSANIVTLNYTTTLEHILPTKDLPIKLNVNDQLSLTLEGVHHIHGYIDDRMIFGINDESQISNDNFKNNQDILTSFIKNHCNIACASNIEMVFSDLIKNSNLICIFGSSIGDSDKLWWEMIGKQMIENNAILIVYIKDSEMIPARRSYKRLPKEVNYRNYIVNQLNIPYENVGQVSKHIFISINSDMFNVLKPTMKSIAPEMSST